MYDVIGKIPDITLAGTPSLLKEVPHEVKVLVANTVTPILMRFGHVGSVRVRVLGYEIGESTTLGLCAGVVEEGKARVYLQYGLSGKRWELEIPAPQDEPSYLTTKSLYQAIHSINEARRVSFLTEEEKEMHGCGSRVGMRRRGRHEINLELPPESCPIPDRRWRIGTKVTFSSLALAYLYKLSAANRSIFQVELLRAVSNDPHIKGAERSCPSSAIVSLFNYGFIRRVKPKLYKSPIVVTEHGVNRLEELMVPK